jgi:hypothetical protein
MGRVGGTNGRDEKFIQNFGWKTEGKMPTGSPTSIRADNIRTNLRVIVLGNLGLHSSGSG